MKIKKIFSKNLVLVLFLICTGLLAGMGTAVWPAASVNAGKLLITEVAFNEAGTDWVELYVVENITGGWGGYRLQEHTSYIKTFPAAWDGTVLSPGDYIVIHEESGSDETTSDTNGNGYWDLYDMGNLVEGDQGIWIVEQSGSTGKVDAVMWSNNDGSLTSGKVTEWNGRVNDGLWDADATFSAADDSDAWTDSDDIDAGESIARYLNPGAPVYNNDNSKYDWYEETSPTMGSINNDTKQDGTGTASITPSTVDKGSTGNTIAVTITGDGVNTLASVSITVPATWSGLTDGGTSLSGSGFSGASKSVVGSTVTVTSTAVTNAATGTITMSGLDAPDAYGSFEFTTRTAVSGGTLLKILTQPKVGIPVPAGAVVINEVCVPKDIHDWDDSEGGDGIAYNSTPGTKISDSDLHQYIELYNASGETLDLTHWLIEITKSSGTFTGVLSSHDLAKMYYSGTGEAPADLTSIANDTYLVIGHPASSCTALTQSVWIKLKDETATLVDDVELGIDDLEEDGTDNNAPKGDGKSASDEVVARKLDPSTGLPVDTDVDCDDFIKRDATPGTKNFCKGVVEINALFGLADTTNIWLTDYDLNTDSGLQELAYVQVTSNADRPPGGILFTLKETGPDTGIFSAKAYGLLLGVTTGPSSGNLIKVNSTGDTITATYNDLEPAGTRTGTAKYYPYVIKINEVSFKITNSLDWVELYCVDDGNNGAGVNIGDTFLWSDGRVKIIAPGTIIKTGEYLVLHPATDSMAVTFLDVGQGDSCVIQTPNDKTVVIDGGRGHPDYCGLHVVWPYLAIYQGIGFIDLMIGTHPDADHIGGLINVLGVEEVKEVWDSGYPGTTDTYHNFLAAIAAETYSEEDDVVYPCTYLANPPLGHTWDDGEEDEPATMSLKVLNNYESRPPGGDSNSSSIVTKLTCGNVSFMLTGDAESSVASGDESKRVEERLIDAYGIGLTSDILKAGHHGCPSATSDAFLDYVNPKETIISVGPNDYGHPDSGTLARIAAHGSNIYRTDELRPNPIDPLSLHGYTFYTNGLTYYQDERNSGSDGIIDTFGFDTLLTNTDEQVLFCAPPENYTDFLLFDFDIIDAVCWSDDSDDDGVLDLSSYEQEDMDDLYKANEWSSNTAESCINSDAVDPYWSIARKFPTLDNNRKDDWEIDSTPTRGRANNSSPASAGIHNLSCSPNPFLSDDSDLTRRDSNISFNLNVPSEVAIYIYDSRGRKVRTLGDEVTLIYGNHSAKWDGKNSSGEPVPTGIYTIYVRAISLLEDPITGDPSSAEESTTVTVGHKLSSGGGMGGSCFIATAAYSGESEKVRKWESEKESHRFTVSPFHPVNTLRQFRDQYLLTNSLGRVFVSSYYRISPPIAHFISNKEALKTITRIYLKPLVWIAKRITLSGIR